MLKMTRGPAKFYIFDEQKFVKELSRGNTIQVFKNAILEAEISLGEKFKNEEKIADLLKAKTSFIDIILKYAWDQFEWDKKISLLAVGGYGRGELHPHSDIDLMILVSSNKINLYQKNIEAFLAFLWDIQLKIGHSVRSISDCVSAAKRDVTIATNIMETRTVCGRDAIRNNMLKKTSPDRIWPLKLWPSGEFFKAKLLEQAKRHAKHGNTEYNLEPNIKEAPGGLRDIQTISWVAKRHFRINSIEELIGDNFITPEEYLQLKRNEAFLWRVRYAVHLIAGRPEEKLTFDHQRKIAKMFGYKDGEKRLGVEQFMQHYYQVVLSIRELTDTLFQCLSQEILYNKKSKEKIILNKRFVINNGYIETTNPDVFDKDPSALLEIFCLAAENNKIIGIRASTIRQIRRYRKSIDESFRSSPDNKLLFLRLLRSPYNMTSQLQRMTRYGILGRYLPEFGAIIGQTQHDMFHQYPVDAHTIQLIENMRSFDKPKEAHRFPTTAYVYKNLPKPELAFIAGLYHDIGKGRGGDHSVLGAVDAAEFCKRHYMSKAESNLVAWLVENHLLMSSTSQRSDISDPDIIHKFAKIIGTQIKLDYLLVLTVADIIATNPELWNSWKASLMRQLYTKTKKALSRGLENPESREEWVKNTKDEAFKSINESSKITVEKIWAGLDDEFFLRENANDIVRYTEAILKNGKENTPVILIKDKGLGTPIATQIFIGTNGLYKVFPIIASTLDKLQLKILDASLHTTIRGSLNKQVKETTFDIFYVVNKDDKPFGENIKIVSQIKNALNEAFRNPEQAVLYPSRRIPQDLKQFSTMTNVVISTDLSRLSTTLEVITPDRPGLLLCLGQIFTKFKLQLISAKISTLGERVEDVFHVVDENYKPLSDLFACSQLVQAICDELDARVKKEIEGAPLQKMSLWN